MENFNFDNFYFTHVDIDRCNYDNIIQELKLHLQPKIDELRQHLGLVKVSTDGIINNCPSLSNWFKQNNMVLEFAALHLMPAGGAGQIHSDHDGSTSQPRLALNINIENADKTKTKLFKVNNSGITVQTPGQGLPYIIYNYSEDTCKQVAEYDLSLPVLFDIVKPHLVTNNTDKLRIALTLRFNSNPIHLITGRP